MLTSNHEGYEIQRVLSKRPNQKGDGSTFTSTNEGYETRPVVPVRRVDHIPDTHLFSEEFLRLLFRHRGEPRGRVPLSECSGCPILEAVACAPQLHTRPRQASIV